MHFLSGSNLQKVPSKVHVNNWSLLDFIYKVNLMGSHCIYLDMYTLFQDTKFIQVHAMGLNLDPNWNGSEYWTCTQISDSSPVGIWVEDTYTFLSVKKGLIWRLCDPAWNERKKWLTQFLWCHQWQEQSFLGETISSLFFLPSSHAKPTRHGDWFQQNRAGRQGTLSW